MRLFVAVDLPEEVKRGLQLLCAGVSGAKWVEAEQIHLTLRFIGEVERTHLAEISDALGAVDAAAFTCALAGVGHFANGRRTHTLWAGLDPCPELLSLHDKVERALTRAGLAAERRKFQPHVTLARLKGAHHGRVGRFVADHNLYRSAPVAVDAFTLYSSHLARAGAIHSAEATYPLQ